MTEDRSSNGVTDEPAFTVYAEPPWLLHLCGELDRHGALALTLALEGPIRRGGTIGLDLAELRFMDSTGINALCDAAQRIGERGRIILIRPTPLVHRIIKICGLTDRFVISDDPSSVRPQ